FDPVPITLGPTGTLVTAGFEPDGTIAWARQEGSGPSDFCTGVAAFPDGSAVVAGAFSTSPASFGDGAFELTTTHADGEVFLASYRPLNYGLLELRPTGLAFAAAAGGADDDRGAGIVAASDGGLFVAGSFRGASTFGTSAGAQDAVLAKYGSDGALAWAQQ